MKIILFLASLGLFSTHSFADKDILKKAAKYQKTEQSNLALYYLLNYLKSNPADFEKYKGSLEKLVNKTGTLPLYSYDIAFLERFEVPTISLHLAHYYFKLREYGKSLDHLNKIPANNSYYPEALLLFSSIYQLQDDKRDLVYLEKCIAESDKFSSFAGEGSYKRYFVMLKENCIINKARKAYEGGKYQEAVDTFDLIDKRSYSWPYLILDKAWAYYQLQDYNRSLGLTMTYNSPLLSSYFFPEAEVLTALSYYQMCLYNDANAMIEKYYKVNKPKVDKLKEVIDRANEAYYFDLVTKDKVGGEHEYIKSLRAQLKKKLRVSVHLMAYNSASEELKLLKANSKADKADIEVMNKILSDAQKLISRYVKEHIYFFINQVNYFSFEMFNLKLEIISRKKDLIYEDKKLVSNRARGSYKNAKTNDQVFFYSFDGQFWADELGDYSFGLKANCQTLKLGPKEDK